MENYNASSFVICMFRIYSWPRWRKNGWYMDLSVYPFTIGSPGQYILKAPN